MSRIKDLILETSSFILTEENENEAKQMIEMLLGTLVPPRRRFLLQHEGEANESD